MRHRAASHVRSITRFAIIIAFACAAPAAAQRIEFRGRGDVDLDRRIRTILERGTHIPIVRDTLLAGTDTLPGDVLVVGATVRVEGVITGELVIVDANVFLRPSARVRGDVVNIAGGYYPSAQATVLGRVQDYPNAPYDVEYATELRRIVGTRRRRLFRPDGFRGLREPRYDRVDGLTAGIGGTYLLPPVGPLEPFIHAFGEYHSRPGDFGGGAEFGVLRDSITFAVGAEHVTHTNESWIRGSFYNSLSYLVRGNDYRNYYRRDHYYVRAAWAGGDPSRSLALDARLGREDPRPLSAGDPWTIFEPDSIRPNPDVGRGRITSATLRSRAGWRQPSYIATIDAEVELGFEAFGGDFDFGRFRLEGEWGMPAIANHTLLIEGYFQGPLPGTDVLPPQRWTFVGGAGTLWTFQTAAFPGDRAVFVATDYVIPLPPAFRLPAVGPLDLELLHRAGMAWTRGAERSIEQNVGVALGTPIVWVHAVTDPSDFADDIEFGVGFRLPRNLPWTYRPPE